MKDNYLCALCSLYLAEERVKDKLAQAAKEKLAMKEKEKQLQLERKKRAQAFLNLLQKDNLSPLRKPLVNGKLFKFDYCFHLSNICLTAPTIKIVMR